MEHIASGFALAEGPMITHDDTLLISDVLGGGIRRFDASAVELAPLLEQRRGIGGMALHRDGSVVVSGRDLSIVTNHGEVVVLATQPDGGTGYNDLTVSPEGDVIAGVLTCHPMAGGELTPGILVQVAPDGTRSQIPLSFNWPNGICFSPAGDRLYVSDFDTGVIHANHWSGSILDTDLVPWFTSPTGDADGLTVDADGSLWLAGGAGGCLLHIDAAGHLFGSLDVPDDFVSSCVMWPEHDRLVITTGSGVFFHGLDHKPIKEKS